MELWIFELPPDQTGVENQFALASLGLGDWGGNGGWWWGVGDGSDLHGDAGELSPPSVGVLMILESGMGRGTGRATGGGGGSRKEPGILLWPPPLGCRWTIQTG